MTETINVLTSMLREWAPLDLFSKLPTRTQVGLFFYEVKLTCTDILPDFLALGTNVGIVYWYDRKRKEMQRLRCENPNVPITSLKIVSTVDYMVACGNALGNISIFQIPKTHPESLPEKLKPKNKQVERYTVTTLHKASISALEWSKNGMKLFSGDKNGCIVLTEIDFYMHICKSVEILNETYEVVQLSYNQQRLLVSTTYRSIVCQKLDIWKICQVGKKDRKVLGHYGGIIIQHGYKVSDTHFYCSRPGLRIWISDIDGNVLRTLIYKELLTKECPEVPLLNPISDRLQSLKPHKEPSFGILLQFNEKYLVTYSNDVVYILDPEGMIILATISHLRGILNIATYKNEIFVLEEERSLIRISFAPESFAADIPYSPVSNVIRPLTSSIKDLTAKLQSGSVISPIVESALPGDVSVHTDETLVMNAEEAVESTKNAQMYEADVPKTFENIGKEDFNDKILYKKSRRRKKKCAMTSSATSLSSNSSEEKDMNYTRPTLMNLSCVGVLPDLRSPESIKYDIEYKEKILADVLNLDKVKIHNGGQEYPSHDHSESDCDNNLEHVGIIKKPEKNKSIRKDTNVIAPSVKRYSSKAGSTLQHGTPPACVNIPNDWKLHDIEVKNRKDSSNSLSSDWEIL